MPLAHDFDWDVIPPPDRMKVSSLRFSILPVLMFVVFLAWIDPAYAACLLIGGIFGVVMMLVIDSQQKSMEVPHLFSKQRRDAVS